MTKLLIKLFVKNSENINDSKVREHYGLLASIFGIVSNIVVCLMKLTLGLIFGLISLVADGLNNLTDAGSSIVSLVGFKLSTKPADSSHPFGHARIEYIAGLIVSLIIVFVGGELIISSVQDIISSFSEEFVPLSDLYFYITLCALAVSILIKLYQGLFYKKIAKRISSATLLAAGCDSRNDVIATSAVLIGLIISKIFSFYIDGYLSLIVGLFILVNGIKLIIETSNPLIGEKPSEELIQKFIEIIKREKNILGYHDLQIHSYGPNIYFATCHVEIDARKNILETHDLIDNVEKEIQRELNVITTLHMDPIVIGDPLTDKIKGEVTSALKDIPYILNIHDFRVVKGPTHINVVFDALIKNEKNLSIEKAMKEIHDKVVSISDKYNPVITIDYDYTSYVSKEKEEE